MAFFLHLSVDISALGNKQFRYQASESTLSVNIPVAPDTESGEHVLRAHMLPRGHFAGATGNLTVNIVRIPLHAELETSHWHAVPFPFTVEGRLYDYNGPLADQPFRLSCGGKTKSSRTDSTGDFRVALDMPSEPAAFQNNVHHLSIQLDDSAYMPVNYNINARALNPFTSALVLALLGGIAALALKKRRSVQPAPAAAGVFSPVITSPAFSKRADELPKSLGEITLLAYMRAVRAVEYATNALMHPAVTIREYLENARNLPAAVYRRFASLSLMAEQVLYSKEARDAAPAEKLAADIERELVDDRTA